MQGGKKRKEDRRVVDHSLDKLISIISVIHAERYHIYILSRTKRSSKIFFFFLRILSVDSGLEIQFTELCSAIHARPLSPKTLKTP